MYAIVIVGGRAEEARGTREDYGGEQQKNRGSSEETGWRKIGHGRRAAINGRGKAENEKGAWKTR